MANERPNFAKEGKTDSGFRVLRDRPDWENQIAIVTDRFNREYGGKTADLPDEVKEMPIYKERASGLLQAKLTSPFWQLAKPQKKQRCLDIGCGVSFLIYAWREWEAFFYGLEISSMARDVLNARGPQLNSKLFKGVELGAAHQLPYEDKQFDLVISTGVSCYYPLAYWKDVLFEVKRVLKPTGSFVFDAIDPEMSTAENWAILETYLGTEIFLEPLSDLRATIQSSGGKIITNLAGEVFQLYKVKF